MISLKMLLVARKRFGRRQATLTSTVRVRGRGRVSRLLHRLRGALTHQLMLPFRRTKRLRWLS